MFGLNQAQLIGRLGADVTIASLASGGRVANMSVATDESFIEKNSGSRVEKTEWHRVTSFQPGLVDMLERHGEEGAAGLRRRQAPDQAAGARTARTRTAYSTEIHARARRAASSSSTSRRGHQRQTPVRRPIGGASDRRRCLPTNGPRRPLRRVRSARLSRPLRLHPNTGDDRAALQRAQVSVLLPANQEIAARMSCALDFSMERRSRCPAGPPVDDLQFRRCGDGAYAVIVFEENVGTVLRRLDVASAERRHVFIAHMYDDPKGPVFIEDGGEVRSTIADLLIQRDLVPCAPPPLHPDFAERTHCSV